MMPPLPPYSDEIREQLLAYGRAVAEAKDAEIAALRADAERYRWLRDRRIPHWQAYDKHGGMLQGKKLDAAIDAALKDEA